MARGVCGNLIENTPISDPVRFPHEAKSNQSEFIPGVKMKAPQHRPRLFARTKARALWRQLQAHLIFVDLGLKSMGFS